MNRHIVVFVEGDTDFVVFKRIIEYYKEKFPEVKSVKTHVVNLKGIGRFSSNACAKLKNDIIPKIKKEKGEISHIICCHDTDVFEFSRNPPINLDKVIKDLQNIAKKSSIEKIEVKSSMEDWMLSDLKGLCSYLKIKKIPVRLSGNSGYEKMKFLFHKADKIYTKGYDCENVVKNIDIETILNNFSEQLLPLKKALQLL